MNTILDDLNPFESVSSRTTDNSAAALPIGAAAVLSFQSSDGGVESRHAGRHWPSPSFAQSAKPMGDCIEQTEAGVAPGPSEAFPSSPAPPVASHNSGERLPSSDAAGGAGEAYRPPPGYVLVERELLGRVVKRLREAAVREREQLRDTPWAFLLRGAE